MSQNDEKVSLSEAMETVRQLESMGFATGETQDNTESAPYKREASSPASAPTATTEPVSSTVAEVAPSPSPDLQHPSAPATASPSVTTSPIAHELAAELNGITVDIVAKLFTYPAQKNIEQHLPTMLSAFHAMNFLDRELILTAFATVRAETAGFVPIDEYKSKYNTDPGAHPFNRYDKRSDIGNRGVPDGAAFKGRGFIQLTGRANYTRYSKVLGLGNTLVTSPEKANDPFIASQILAAFIQQHESRIKKAIAQNNLRKVRRLVNGGSHGLKVFVQAFQTGYPLIVG